MKIGLFIPCYIDQFYPHVGIATLQLLEKLGYDVGYPLNQTCCGQPMANAGFENYGESAGKLFIKTFSEYDYIVSPSGSCIMHIKEHLKVPGHTPEVVDLHHKAYELCEFLTDIARVKDLDVTFPYKVGLHASCHGLRGLRLASASELNDTPFNKPRSLLQKVKGIELVDLSRPDECCGFGGTFAVSEEAISVQMGKDRVQDHLTHGAQVITGADMSCLMHMEGILKRQGSTVRVMHIAEILNS